jgi:hypothetical protein
LPELLSWVQRETQARLASFCALHWLAKAVEEEAINPAAIAKLNNFIKRASQFSIWYVGEMTEQPCVKKRKSSVAFCDTSLSSSYCKTQS